MSSQAVVVKRRKKNRRVMVIAKKRHVTRATTVLTIPARVANPIFQRTLRFQGPQESKDAILITNRCLQNIMFVATGSSGATGKSILSSVHLDHVGMYSPPSATNYQYIDFEWSGQQGPERSMTAYGTNSALAKISAVPPEGSQASMWINLYQGLGINNTSSVLFAVGGSNGFIVDVTIRFTLIDPDTSDAATSLTVDVGSVSDGAMVINYLDNTSAAIAAGTQVLVPVGFSNTAAAHG